MTTTEFYGLCPRCHGSVKRAFGGNDADDFFFCTESCIGNQRFFITFSQDEILIPVEDVPPELHDEDMDLLPDEHGYTSDFDLTAFDNQIQASYSKGYVEGFKDGYHAAS